MGIPSVSILLPVLDEVEHIDACLDSLLGQDYPGELEVIVAEGGSRDGTRELLEDLACRDRRLRIVANPRRLQADGLNRAARAAAGEILVRADAHSTYAPDYVRRSIAVLAETGAVAVGGRLRPVGSSATGRAIAAAMRSPLAIGPGRFHHAERRERVDTVYLGAFRRDDFLAHGGFRSLPSGIAEDADFYWRWGQAGRAVVVDPTIRSTYQPRETVRAFIRQNWRYGRGKAEMLWLNGRLPSWRPLAPFALVAGLVVGTLLAARGRRTPLVGLLGSWTTLVGTVALQADAQPFRTAAVVAGMHLAYGAGLAYGLLRGPAAVNHLR